ncbi:1,6-dihydroxycyclohexa-2,4-diene-1-carboxylate dehydrogenase [Mycobacterium saskatchewanense]|uniref:2,3-dihydroxy-2,3-dihydro-p-cumate dehydrogenase n=2 Tax=Mycobacterium saskatchewanense TaxID=220927 RepID=A0AAJ3NUH5_9MYCO|nr:2,3-dihydroxy-2,3-dihydro-p-cumate dehydrogenase [Mycobacterium saskatchewanense]BBX65187.1 1,6-dihydroxycyclohexa-2,4-diene-1-carboxylate dehydrogenase [Mycobacterium saskatchewanense]
MDISGRNALITGAASGLGLGIAQHFASLGVRVCLADRDEANLEQALATIPANATLGPIAIVNDLSTRSGARATVQSALDSFGKLDILVNNAGGGVIRPTLTHTEETLRETVDRNLWTMLYTTLEVLPHMIARQYGRVVSIGAESVRNGLWQHAVYSAAKGAVHGITPGLAREFAADNITFNVVAPAMVITPQLSAAIEQMPEDQRRQYEEFFEQIRGSIPLGRGGTLDEVAAAVAYLASDNAGFVTGQVLSVNGGSSML